MPREKSRYRERRSSSYSSDSSYERKKSKSRHKRRSISRERESSSVRRKRSTSRSRRRRSYSRSASRDRYDKSRRRSTSRSRSKRDHRSRSQSSSRSRKHKSSRKTRRHSRSSSSRSSSYEIERPNPPKKVNLDDTESKVEKAIKAAEAVGLTMTKIPTYEYKEVEIKEDMPTIHDRNLLAELNSDTFIQRSFVSSKKKESKNIVIDLNTQTVKLPETEIKQKDDSIIDFSEIPSEEELKEMWIKKLYQYRKRMLKGEI